MIYAPTNLKGQESYFCHGVDEYRLTAKRDIVGLCDNTHPYFTPPPKCNSLYGKPLKRTFKNCSKNAFHNCYLLAGMWVGKDSVFF